MKIDAVLLIESGHQDQESLYAKDRLQESVSCLEIVGPNTSDVKGKYGIPIKVTKHWEDLDRLNPDITIIPGGWQCPELLRMNPLVINFLRRMNDLNKLIGAICHGPQVLISAGLCKNRKMTCYPGVKDDLINAGSHYYDTIIIIDGNIITCSHYKYNHLFIKAVLDCIKT